ncbi:MAG: hypothetical protein GY705_25400 [Bacteroidetes bacterium]|nr:hypothetical protein [Bacteroidota bacterium]
MNLENLVGVSGLPGIFRMAANRDNGLIIEDLDTGKRKFAPSRKHQFTPLESIGIFTDDGKSIEVKKVFRSMLEKLTEHPPVPPNAKPQELHDYFSVILPNYDQDNVSTGDIKKVIKWFNFLNERSLIDLEEEKEDTASEEEE